MASQRQFSDAVHRFMGGLTARIVADSGRPSDRFHLGKIILQSLKDAPDFVLQINGASGQSETSGSVLERSIKCATSFRGSGLKIGDVVVIMAPNHLDLTVPFYASLYNGLAIAPVDSESAVQELEEIFTTCKPRVVFCQSEKLGDVQLALKSLHLDTTIIITFDESPNSLEMFQENFQSNVPIEEFRVADFDPSETLSFLISTSGTTGTPKCAASTHLNIVTYLPYWLTIFDTFPEPTKSVLMVSPIQWVSAQSIYLYSVIFRITRVQTPAAVTTDHIYEVINKYKPTFMVSSPNFTNSLVKARNRDQCDFTTFEVILLGGSAVNIDDVKDIKALAPNTIIVTAYGMSEIGVALAHYCDSRQDLVALRRTGNVYTRLVNPDTGKEIVEPNVCGELCMKGPSVFKGYYNNPESTKAAFSEDGWLKSGDMFYKDQHHNYFFVDRIKMLLKYRNHQISPVEIEGVIRQHPAVSDVAVIGLPDPDNGELPVACVVRRHGYDVTAEEIKTLVKETLTDSKNLRGGVVFMNSLPLTPSTKINRKKLKEIVCDLKRE